MIADERFIKIPKVSGIYAIINTLNNNMYIGSALNLNKRIKVHFRELKYNRHDNKYLQNAYLKHGETVWEFKILEFVDSSFLMEKEQYYLDTLNPKYNILKKAYTSIGYKHTLEMRRRFSEQRKGIKPSEETLLKRSISLKGKKRTLETRLKMSEAQKGRITPLETRLKQSKVRKERGLVGYHRGVLQLDKENNIIAEFFSIAEASRKLGISSSGISNYLTGRSKSAGGYFWKYKQI